MVEHLTHRGEVQTESTGSICTSLSSSAPEAMSSDTKNRLKQSNKSAQIRHLNASASEAYKVVEYHGHDCSSLRRRRWEVALMPIRLNRVG